MLSSSHSPPLAASTSRPTAASGGQYFETYGFSVWCGQSDGFGREQVFEDFRVEKPETVSWGAWQKRQSRQIAKILDQVARCHTGDDIVNLATTILKPTNLEASLLVSTSIGWFRWFIRRVIISLCQRRLTLLC